MSSVIRSANFSKGALLPIFLPFMQISKLEFAVEKVDKYTEYKYATFMCDNRLQEPLLKLFFAISQHGDPGHTYGILFDGNHVGWDGDGSDRIQSVNFIKEWKDKDFYEYLEKLPEKVLNFSRAKEALFQNMRNLPTDSPLWDNNTSSKVAETIAKKLGDKQYEKFLQIKEENKTKK